MTLTPSPPQLLHSAERERSFAATLSGLTGG